MLLNLWNWITKEPHEKSLTRELIEIALLYVAFLLIVLAQNEIPTRWIVLSVLLLGLSFWESGRELLRIALLAAVIVFGFIRPFVVQAFYIPSRSMENTLLVNDHIFVNKFIFWFIQPQRWDIIVFEYPNNPNKDYIKRLVGLPGDTVVMKNRQLIINGNKVRRKYLHSEVKLRFADQPLAAGGGDPPTSLRFKGDGLELNRARIVPAEDTTNPVGMHLSVFNIYREKNHKVKEVQFNGRARHNFSANFGPLYIPEKGDVIDLTELEAYKKRYYFYLIKHHTNKSVSVRDNTIYRNGVPITEYKVTEDLFFVLGDNRDHSEDSRVWGFVPRSRLEGRAFFIYWPPSRIGLIGD